jgi:hypothetical protein
LPAVLLLPLLAAAFAAACAAASPPSKGATPNMAAEGMEGCCVQATGSPP